MLSRVSRGPAVCVMYRFDDISREPFEKQRRKESREVYIRLNNESKVLTKLVLCLQGNAYEFMGMTGELIIIVCYIFIFRLLPAVH